MAPVWFKTLSSGDLYWPNLFRCIYPWKSEEDCLKMKYNERFLALSKNPVIACRVFRKRLNEFF